MKLVDTHGAGPHDFPPERLALMTEDDLAALRTQLAEDVAVIQSQLSRRRPVGTVADGEHLSYAEWRRRAVAAMTGKAAAAARVRLEIARRHDERRSAAGGRSPKAILISLVKALDGCDLPADVAALVAEARAKVRINEPRGEGDPS